MIGDKQKHQNVRQYHRANITDICNYRPAINEHEVVILAPFLAQGVDIVSNVMLPEQGVPVEFLHAATIVIRAPTCRQDIQRLPEELRLQKALSSRERCALGVCIEQINDTWS